MLIDRYEQIERKKIYLQHLYETVYVFAFQCIG